jgi:putative transposase
MKRFKSARQLQRFVSIRDPIVNLFHIPRHDISSDHHREIAGRCHACVERDRMP